MAKPKPISKEMCLAAMAKTKSVLAAARYLNCSYQHLKPYMQSYKDEETGLSLFELDKKQVHHILLHLIHYSWLHFLP